MISKISRSEALKEFPVFPQRFYDKVTFEESYSHIPAYRSHTYTVTGSLPEQHDERIINELAHLSQLLHWDPLIFLGDTTLSWLRQYNEYTPARKAFEYFEKQKLGRRFNGALKVEITDLAPFLAHFLNLVRYNAALPNFHFTGKPQNFLGYFCQYGNLHLDSINKEADSKIFNAIQKTSLSVLTGQCNSSPVWGRQTLL